MLNIINGLFWLEALTAGRARGGPFPGISSPQKNSLWEETGGEQRGKSQFRPG